MFPSLPDTCWSWRVSWEGGDAAVHHFTQAAEKYSSHDRDVYKVPVVAETSRQLQQTPLLMSCNTVLTALEASVTFCLLL